MTAKTIDEIADKLVGQEISCLTFTGGEPTFATYQMNRFYEALNDFRIPLHRFYIATNGAGNNSPELLTLLAKMYGYCDEPEMCELKVSNTAYHVYERDIMDLGLLECLSFANADSLKKHKEVWASTFIAEGRLHDNDDARDPKHERHDGIYVNVFGEVMTNCNLSYSNQKKFSLGHVNDVDIVDLWDKIKDEC